jgi:hypothetical protein
MGALDDHDISIVALTTLDDDGHYGVQPDFFGEGSGGPPFELHHPFGFLSRAMDPGPDGKGCYVHRAYEGSRGHAWYSYDPRVMALLPPVPKGGSIQYNARGDFHIINQKGQQILYSKWGDKSLTIEIDPVSGAITILHGDGMAFVLFDGKAIVRGKGGATYVEVSETEVVLNGNVRITGTLGVGPAPTLPIATLAGSPAPNSNIMVSPPTP